MNIIKTALMYYLLSSCFVISQDYSHLQDSTLNNLIHPEGYKTCSIGDPGGILKSGSGTQSLIIISGIGFSALEYKGIISHYENDHSVYTITPAGFGGTPAPEMPDTGVKYAELSWTNGIVTAILNMIEKEKLYKPDIIAHFITGTQAAILLALEHNEKIGKVIIIGGSPYRFYAGLKDGQWNDWENEKKITPEQRSAITESYWAPKWFKTVTKKTWDSFMWTPDDYCKDTVKGKILFDISASIPLQVMIRYLIEWGASDPSDDFNKIKNPLLILIPDFKELLNPQNSDDPESCKQASAKMYLKGFHQDTWKPAAESMNPLIHIKTVSDTRLFMWLDNPDETFLLMDDFLKEK